MTTRIGYSAAFVAIWAAYITSLFKQGVDLQTIMRNVGHRQIKTTLAYISEPGALQRQAVDGYDKTLRKVLKRRKFTVIEGGK